MICPDAAARQCCVAPGRLRTPVYDPTGRVVLVKKLFVVLVLILLRRQHGP